MDERALACQRGALDDLVVPVDGQRAALLVDHGLDEGVEIARIEAGGVARHLAGEVRLAHDGDTAVLDILARLGQLDPDDAAIALLVDDEASFAVEREPVRAGLAVMADVGAAIAALGAIDRERRVRRDPPTLDEAIFAAIGITDDVEQQADIAASLMGMPYETVLAEVKKQSRTLARASTRVIAGEQGAQRSVVVERRVVRRFGNDKRTGT